MHGIVETCRTAWPGIDVPDESFVRHLAENLPDDKDPTEGLDRLHGPDLYLACGCMLGLPAALEAFDGTILAQTIPVLQRMRLSPSRIDEVLQTLRTRLLVADERDRPVIATYAGRGPLLGWVRTSARRTAVSMSRNKDEQIGSAGDRNGPEAIPLPRDLELDYMKTRYQHEFQQAVEDAIASLDPEKMNILRLHYIDGLSIDRIGALLQVHRATAARWIEAAREAVRSETRRLLHARLGLKPAELDSLAGLVQSRLHLSISRLLQK